MSYESKYLKYKTKYLELKKLFGGNNSSTYTKLLEKIKNLEIKFTTIPELIDKCLTFLKECTLLLVELQKNEFQKFWNRVGKKKIKYRKPAKQNAHGELADYNLGLLLQLLIFETASNSLNIKLRKASLSYEKMNISTDFVNFLNDKIKTQDEYNNLLMDADVQ